MYTRYMNRARQRGLVILLGAGMVLGACAPMHQAAPPGIHEVEGRIVDARGGQMMLNNGTVLLIPGTVARASELSLGAVVRVQYEEKDGQKVATAMMFRQRGEGQSGM